MTINISLPAGSEITLLPVTRTEAITIKALPSEPAADPNPTSCWLTEVKLHIVSVDRKSGHIEYRIGGEPGSQWISAGDSITIGFPKPTQA